jgi:hypothetical protein
MMPTRPIDPDVIELTIAYRGNQHTIRLAAATKQDAIRELKRMAMSAEDGFLGDTIDWLFKYIWTTPAAAP